MVSRLIPKGDRLVEVWLYSLSSAVKQTSKTLQKIHSLIQYVCFIVVVFIHSCHHHLKMSTFRGKKNKFLSVYRSDPLVINATIAFTNRNCLEHEFLKRFLVRGWVQSFRNFSIISNILDLEWSLSNKRKRHSTTVHSQSTIIIYLPRCQRWWT